MSARVDEALINYAKAEKAYMDADFARAEAHAAALTAWNVYFALKSNSKATGTDQ